MENTLELDNTSLKDSRNVQNRSVCNPISTLKDVWTFTLNPPEWIKQIVELTPRSSTVVRNTDFYCHIKSEDFKPTSRLSRTVVPRTIVCHDMKGGYIEDRFVSPINIGNGYSFYRWAQIDIFIYFSHHLITIPPLAWINTAHANGVKILGTFITEWNSGDEICKEIFKNPSTVENFVKVMVDICAIFKIDGWLLNIENEIDNVELLTLFIRQLTDKLHKQRPNSSIIWYDSVTAEGKLKWQNELNELNRCYFDICDGIFLNYTWKDENIVRTVKAAGHRCLDVYVGVDVFGRNSYGGGHFNTYLAAEKIREHNLSMAIFAPGWTHETLPLEPSETFLDRFISRDAMFWKSLWPYLYTHPIVDTFCSFFYIGVDKEWFKLHLQDVQLSNCLLSSEILVETSDVPTLKETCNCLQLSFNETHTSCFITKKHLKSDECYVHHLFTCNMTINGSLILYYYYKDNKKMQNANLRLVLLVMNGSGSFTKIVCHSNQDHLNSNATVININPTKSEDIINAVSYHSTIPKDWKLKCYDMSLQNCTVLEVGFEIGTGHSACICGIGFKKYNNGM